MRDDLMYGKDAGYGSRVERRSARIEVISMRLIRRVRCVEVQIALEQRLSKRPIFLGQHI